MSVAFAAGTKSKMTNKMALAIKEFRDGLTMESLGTKFPWLLKAEFSDAVIGQSLDGKLIWYDGTWENGTFRSGDWLSGTFWSGTFRGRTWRGGTWCHGTWRGKTKRGSK